MINPNSEEGWMEDEYYRGQTNSDAAQTQADYDMALALELQVIESSQKSKITDVSLSLTPTLISSHPRLHLFSPSP